nr:hypothetical protein [Tanacetum cinerariifolium]
DSILIGVEDFPFNMEEDILFLEGLLIEDPSPPYPIIPNQTKSLIEEPKHSFNMGYEHFNTNLVTNDVTESSTKNLVPIPRECEDSDFDNPSVPLPPLEPPDEEFDFEIDFGVEISVVMNTIVKFECIDARVVFNDENDDLSYFMLVIFDKDLPPVIEVFLC